MYVSPISSRFWFGRLTPAMRATGRYPCLCLCRGLVQMTMVVPCRFITRQRSRMRLTDGRTFISAVPVGDSTAVEVVGAELDLDLVAREDPDVVLPHRPGDGREHGMDTPVELHPAHRARERLEDLAFNLDLLFLGRQIPLSEQESRTETRTRRSRARRRSS